MPSSPSAMSPPCQPKREERETSKGPTVMFERWEQMMLLHWRWDPSLIQRTLPAGLTVDVAEGSAWLGLTPVFMRNVRPRFIPTLAGASSFLALNLRTYVVDAEGRPGLYFYSLDCNQPLVVDAARRLLHLRYEHSGQTATLDPDGSVNFFSQRKGSEAGRDRFQYRISPDEGRAPMPGLEVFLIERHRVFGIGGPSGRLTSVQFSHAPLRLHPVELTGWGVNALLQSGFVVGVRPPDHVCGAGPLEVDVSMPGVSETSQRRSFTG